jgi:hypothetical protein
MIKILALLGCLSLAAPFASAESISPWALQHGAAKTVGLESGASAYNLRQKYADVNLWQATEVASFADVQRIFETVRDERNILDPSHQDFMRRTTWLWANDGCFIRSFHMASVIHAREALRLTQIFLFGGRMLAKPEWREGWEGGLPWNYHVTPVVRVGATVYVLDPAVDQKKPLEISEWIASFVQDVPALEGAICGPFTFGPNEECWATQPSTNPEGMPVGQWNTYFFNNEWQNVERRGFDPLQLLGDRPPWMESL